MSDMDHADVRKFSEENVYLRLEALLESIDARRTALDRGPGQALDQVRGRP